MQRRLPSCCTVANVLRCISQGSDGKGRKRTLAETAGMAFIHAAAVPYWLRGFEPLSACACVSPARFL